MPLSRDTGVTVVTVAAAVVEEIEPEGLDDEVVETDGATLPAADEQPQPVAEVETVVDEDADAEFQTEDTEDADEGDDEGDQHEVRRRHIGDTGREEPPPTVTHAFSRRHRYDRKPPLPSSPASTRPASGCCW